MSADRAWSAWTAAFAADGEAGSPSPLAAQTTTQPRPWPWLWALAVAVAYAVSGKIGLLLAFAGSNVSPVFPAAGVAAGALLLGGWRMLPGVWLGALVLNLDGMPAPLAPWVATGNTLAAVVIVALLRRVGWDCAIDRLRHVGTLLLAGLVGCLVAALNGITALCAGGLIPWTAFPSAWWTWWMGDLMGVLLVTPLLITWARAPHHGSPPLRALEGTALAAATLLVSALVFTPWGPWGGSLLSMSYLVFPLVLWAAVRCDGRVITAITALISLVAVIGTVSGFGPFASFATLNERLLALQFLLATAALSGLALAAALHERHVAQVALGRASLALDQAGDLIVLTDADGVVTYANLAAQRRLGPPGLVGRRFADLVTDDPCASAKPLRETTLLCPDGAPIPVEIACSPLPGEPAPGMIAIARDLSERRDLQARLTQVSTFAAIGRMAGGVAHDFNNLLAVILGFAESALAKLPIGHPSRMAVEHVQEAGHRAAAMTRQLLAVGRRQMLRPQHLDLAAAAVAARPVLAALAGPGLTLELEPSPPQWVRADPSQVQQILLNLVANARDAQPAGGRITISVATVELDRRAVDALTVADPVATEMAAPGSWVRLAVADAGSGIDVATRQRLFEPFFTTKDEGRGTGLGLATVLGIVRQSGGFIAITSSPGRGTVMAVHLPPATVRLLPEATAHSGLRRSLGRLRIVVCDDEPAIAELVTELLNDLGMDVRFATGVVAARRLLAEGDPADLLISDVLMPDGGGPALVAAARAADPCLAVLYLSGNVMDHRLDLKHAGFLAKPLGRGALLAAIQQALAVRPQS